MEPRLSFSRLRLGPIYLASADASIACWNAKYTFNFWRPITAIQNGDAVAGSDWRRIHCLE
jgi:hypothetical protein